MHLRLHGDPFGDDASAACARALLRGALQAGCRCSLSLGAVAGRPALAGQTVIPLTDGVRDFSVGTDLPGGEIEMLLAAAAEAVVATAPVVVFGPPEQREDLVAAAGFEWPEACWVGAAEDAVSAADLLATLGARQRGAGVADHPLAMAERELLAWTGLPPAPGDGAVVHVGSADHGSGIDVVLCLWREVLAGSGRKLRLVTLDAGEGALAGIARELAASGGVCEFVPGPLEPRHLADAALVLLPWRTLRAAPVVVQALASARPLCLSRWAATAAIADRPGVCYPIGGRRRDRRDGASWFEPDVDAAAAAVANALGPGARAVGARGRRLVLERFVRGAVAPSPARVDAAGDRRPVVVLEAPFFETSSSAELSIETALALRRRGHVDLRLVPRTPLCSGLGEFRRRAPELVPLLARRPGRADLWLASGWPVRCARPDCTTFALRVDWEYGALPVELAPAVTDEADLVVVHSDHVAGTILAAGRSPVGLHVVPHGVDAAIDDAVAPDPEIMAWKGGRPAVLFCGGLVWRKGFDVFLRAVLAARRAGADFAVVVKAVGGDSHYRGFDLRGLVERFAATRGTPPIRLVERSLSRGQLAGLYTACDLLLHPYRGEGFCLPVLEARAAGLPVLATAGGATDALMAGPGAVQIPSVRRQLELPGVHLGRPWVLEPCADGTARLLGAALADLHALRQQARSFAPAVRAAYTWAAAAQAIERMADAARRGGSRGGEVEPGVPGRQTTTTCSSFGPCTPTTSCSSMSAVRDGPVTNVTAGGSGAPSVRSSSP